MSFEMPHGLNASGMFPVKSAPNKLSCFSRGLSLGTKYQARGASDSSSSDDVDENEEDGKDSKNGKKGSRRGSGCKVCVV